MSVPLELINQVLYFMQQLGIALGVGAESVMLVAYLSAVKDGIIDKEEAQFARAVHNVLYVGVLCIILSGIGVTALHLFLGEAAIVFLPAYLFKWVLIVAVLSLGALWYVLPQSIINGLTGSVWYALFVLHIFSSDTATWGMLLFQFGIWIVGFNLVWWGAVYVMQPHVHMQAKKPVPIPTAPPIVVAKPTVAPASMTPKITPATPSPPPAPKPTPPPPTPPPVPVPHNLPVVRPQELSTTKKVEQKIIDPDQSPGLPALTIMPKTPQEVDKQNRATVVDLDPANNR
jgi:hypothetical protein